MGALQAFFCLTRESGQNWKVVCLPAGENFFGRREKVGYCSPRNSHIHWRIVGFDPAIFKQPVCVPGTNAVCVPGTNALFVSHLFLWICFVKIAELKIFKKSVVILVVSWCFSCFLLSHGLVLDAPSAPADDILLIECFDQKCPGLCQGIEKKKTLNNFSGLRKQRNKMKIKNKVQFGRRKTVREELWQTQWTGKHCASVEDTRLKTKTTAKHKKKCNWDKNIMGR